MANVALAQGVDVGTAETSIYQTNPSLVKSKVDSAWVVSNDAAGSVTIQVWVTPDASSGTSNSRKVIDTFEIGINDSRPLTPLIGQIVNSGGQIIASASATGCAIWLNGRTFKTDI